MGDRGEYTATYVPVSGAENYNPLTARVTLDITKAPLTITGADVAPRAYKEGNRSAEIQRLTFRGLVNGETLTIGEDYFATGAFSDENAGENKTVTVTPFLADNDKAGNYRLADSSFQTTGTISKAPWDIQVTGVPDELTYGDTFGWASLRARLLLLLPGTRPDRRQVDHLIFRGRGTLHAGDHPLGLRLRGGRVRDRHAGKFGGVRDRLAHFKKGGLPFMLQNELFLYGQHLRPWRGGDTRRFRRGRLRPLLLRGRGFNGDA